MPPRSLPTRSAATKKTLLTWEAVIVRYAAMHLPASSNSGGGVQTQLLTPQITSAPWTASSRATSGNQMSQQISKPMRPISVSNTG